MKLLKLPEVLKLTAKSRSSHYADIKAERMTPPVLLGVHSVAWPDYEINAINAARVAGKSDDEIRALVSDLKMQRTNPLHMSAEKGGV